MNKIPTLFVRDPNNMSRVTREVTPGCEWVLAGEGCATRKWDGTNVRVTVSHGCAMNLEKRRNPTREEKAAGAEPGYVLASRDDPSDKHIFAAADATDYLKWPDGAWSCEAIGPKIQGGADGEDWRLVPFSLPGYAEQAALAEFMPRTWGNIRDILNASGWEGIVWHHPDGRMAKIKRRDFGFKWPVLRVADVAGVSSA